MLRAISEPGKPVSTKPSKRTAPKRRPGADQHGKPIAVGDYVSSDNDVFGRVVAIFGDVIVYHAYYSPHGIQAGGYESDMAYQVEVVPGPEGGLVVGPHRIDESAAWALDMLARLDFVYESCERAKATGWAIYALCDRVLKEIDRGPLLDLLMTPLTQDEHDTILERFPQADTTERGAQ